MTQRHSVKCSEGIAVAPHALAAESAVAVLREGGNAVEAMVAAAATIAVVYPHMNGIGGDGFWLIARPGCQPVAIQACGYAAAEATITRYQQAGYAQVPVRGPLAANTVAGTVAGWEEALSWARQHLDTVPLPLTRLLKDAIGYAREGVPVSPGLHQQITSSLATLGDFPGFSALFAPNGQPLTEQEKLFQPALAETLETLATNGLSDFYRGDVARRISTDLEAAGSPLHGSDLADFTARQVKALSLQTVWGTVYNLPPPSQGMVTLLITGIIEQQRKKGLIHSEADFVHQCVEATKLAFNLRDHHITDPTYMHIDPQSLLASAALATLSDKIDTGQAREWGGGKGPADTIWMGAADHSGTTVSFIQSIYHEFGSAVILPETGIIWQNRGSSFSLDPTATNPLQPGRLPFHTLNPGLACLKDGGMLAYGSMGGDGQPQTLATLFDRIFYQHMSPQQAISAPRWLLGRTWGESSDSLKVENRITEQTLDVLRQYGHPVDVYPPFDSLMGHAGVVLRDRNGLLEAGYDPRSDGGVARW